jgi:hypothetical protein
MELDTAGPQYDHNLTLTILDSLVEAGGRNGPDPESYRFPLRNKRGFWIAMIAVVANTASH